jgi:2-oxoisovalerate dehydrogenase E2 component (dihydrolipoyl transacylase)
MDFPLPPLGEGVYEAELVRWLVKPGNAVRRGQSLAEVMTDKATAELPSPFVGTIVALTAEAGSQVKVGESILRYDPAAGGSVDASAPAALTQPSLVIAPVHTDSASVKASPSVRHKARELGIDLATVIGSGPGGRILSNDLTAASQRPAQALDVGVAGTRVKMSGLRRRIAEHLVEAKRHIPHYSYIDEVDVTDLVMQRSAMQDEAAGKGVKLTYLAFFVQAAVRALREVPIVNATFDETAGEIVMHDHYDIGIAVATPGGLIVPVIRGAAKMDIWSVGRELERLSADARAGKIKREDLGGSTFTVTSIGGIGGLISTPIINYPEVAILGVGKIVKRPIYDDAGNVKPADMVYLSLSFDHRIVDGAIGATFGNALAMHLKDPATLTNAIA